MSHRKRGPAAHLRVGKVSVYAHHGAWWLYYRDGGLPVRRKVAKTRPEAEQVAAQINAQLSNGAPTLLAFTPVTAPELRQRFLDYHESVLKSSMGAVRRYRAATRHLEDFVGQPPLPPQAHEVRPDAFAAYLRRIEVAPNGHQNTAKRKLRDKGAQFILETCRSMYTFALKRRHLPPYAGNPFSELPLDRLKIEDAKPIFVFDADVELAFFQVVVQFGFLALGFRASARQTVPLPTRLIAPVLHLQEPPRLLGQCSQGLVKQGQALLLFFQFLPQDRLRRDRRHVGRVGRVEQHGTLASQPFPTAIVGHTEQLARKMFGPGASLEGTERFEEGILHQILHHVGLAHPLEEEAAQGPVITHSQPAERLGVARAGPPGEFGVFSLLRHVLLILARP